MISCGTYKIEPVDHHLRRQFCNYEIQIECCIIQLEAYKPRNVCLTLRFLFRMLASRVNNVKQITSISDSTDTQYIFRTDRSILLIKSELKWCIHLSRSLFLYFNYFEWHSWWTRESPRAHAARFYGRLRLIRSVWEHQNFPCWNCLKL